MKKIKSLVNAVCIAVTLAASASASASETFPVLKGYWFGQQAPGLTPELFAPDTVSVNGRYEFGLTFSPNLDEMYFTALDVIEGVDTRPKILYSKIEDGRWTEPKTVNFTNGKMSYELVPYASLKENRVYFTARSPHEKGSGIWYVSRENGELTKAKRFDSPINNGKLSDLNQGKSGDLVFTNMSERQMYYAKNENGQYLEAKPMDIDFGIHGFISPSEDYLLVNSRTRSGKNRRDSDLFVYFKEQDGSWSDPINLGDTINTTYSETVARVSPDGKYLFFARYNEPDSVSNIYWVSTDVIAKLKKDYFNK
ncbi:PD40 domain-containing protein [Pseudoalteromonas luteoviolacea]|uniref:PD40 domain-containing protein n=1 Tax=Pseudoalteromonas luteoviolacea TaxID=43657 RepID=UPI001B387FBE|nr:PD40 domain-containing protein [Pseudoalteromonas luteoviolacea]MBQ4835781.1 PD40 domain-containing protein [Pseudoalteromonas luteoviolacea]